MRRIRNLDNYLYDKYNINYAYNHYDEYEELIDTVYKDNIVEWHYDYFINFKNVRIKLRKIVEEDLETNSYNTNIYEI